jgi:hypothetical protein
MSEIKITVEIPQLDVLITAIKNLAGTTTGKGPVKSTETTKKPAVKSEPTPKPQENIPQSEPEKQYTIEEVRAVFMKCAKAHGKDEVKKILAELGVTKVTEIKQEDFAKAVKAVEEVK